MTKKTPTTRETAIASVRLYEAPKITKTVQTESEGLILFMNIDESDSMNP